MEGHRNSKKAWIHGAARGKSWRGEGVKEEGKRLERRKGDGKSAEQKGRVSIAHMAVGRCIVAVDLEKHCAYQLDMANRRGI